MVRTEKDAQRDLIRRLKKSFDATQLAFYSEQLAQSLFENSHYQTARNVALFASLPDEPDTTAILAHALNDDKKFGSLQLLMKSTWKCADILE